jgi:hypothetical protein
VRKLSKTLATPAELRCLARNVERNIHNTADSGQSRIVYCSSFRSDSQKLLCSIEGLARGPRTIEADLPSCLHVQLKLERAVHDNLPLRNRHQATNTGEVGGPHRADKPHFGSARSWRLRSTKQQRVLRLVVGSLEDGGPAAIS